jgi:hypothetical protein
MKRLVSCLFGDELVALAQSCSVVNDILNLRHNSSRLSWQRLSKTRPPRLARNTLLKRQERAERQAAEAGYTGADAVVAAAAIVAAMGDSPRILLRRNRTNGRG